jgi:hypothetical protein
MGIKNLVYRPWVSSPVNKAFILTDIQKNVFINEDNTHLDFDVLLEESDIKGEYSLVQLIEEHKTIGLQWKYPR